MIMLDTNVLIELIEEDDVWFNWSATAVARAAKSERVTVSPVVIGELASGGRILPAMVSLLQQLDIMIWQLDAPAAQLAGEAHRAYRQAGGKREKLLSDFLIGGHAAAEDATLITRDPRRYQAYFPQLPLITPETEHG